MEPQSHLYLGLGFIALGLDEKDTHDIIFSETAEEIDFTGGTKGNLRPSYMSLLLDTLE